MPVEKGPLGPGQQPIEVEEEFTAPDDDGLGDEFWADGDDGDDGGPDPQPDEATERLDALIEGQGAVVDILDAEQALRRRDGVQDVEARYRVDAVPVLLGNVLRRLERDGFIVPPAFAREQRGGPEPELRGFVEVRNSARYHQPQVRQLFRMALARVTALPADNIQAIGAAITGSTAAADTAALLEALRRHGRVLGEHNENFGGALDLQGPRGAYRALCTHWALDHAECDGGVEFLVTQDFAGVTIYAWPDARGLELMRLEAPAAAAPEVTAAGEPAAQSVTVENTEGPEPAPPRRRLQLPTIEP